MTVEHRIMVGLTDIKSVSFQCDRCKYRITMSPEDIKDFDFSCPNGHPWKQGRQEGLVKIPLLTFTESLAKLRASTAQQLLGFHVLLEFDEPTVI